MAPKMAFFTGFGPRRAAGLAEQPKFLFAIVIWHLNEHSVRVSALNSKILSFSTPLHVVLGSIFHVVQECIYETMIKTWCNNKTGQFENFKTLKQV